MITRRIALLGLAATAVAAASGCSGSPSDGSGSSSSGGTQGPSAEASPSTIGHRVAVNTGLASGVLPSDDEGALAVSRLVLAEATAVVVVQPAPPTPSAPASPSAGASPSNSASPSAATSPTPAAGGDVAAASATAAALGLPLLIAGPELAAELNRLQTRTVIAYPAAGLDLGDREVVDGPADPAELQVEGLPAETAPATAAALRPRGESVSAATAAILAAAGIALTEVPFTDPRATAESVALVKGATGAVLGVGAFGDSARFAARVEAARTLPELPGGGVAPFPGRMMVALYGHPSGGTLGVLGEQGPEQSVARVKELAAQYQAFSDVPVIGAFEIITTVASASAGPDGDYSYETPAEQLLPYIEAAEAAGIYCVLDLQPGHTDFLTQAKRYEELLKRPTVGLAIDPEWRLKPGQRHMTIIGQVEVDEVNATGAWLADLVAANSLPPKVVILHQFQQRMIVGRERLDTTRDELQYLVHADGHGNPPLKQATWRNLKEGLPANVWLGWKNFIDEDSPTMTPQETMEDVEPRPNFVSYQ
ncbi:hypothetical protein [Tessaracoccus sp. Y1736]